MTNNEIIRDTVRNAFSADQLAALVSACYTPAEVSAAAASMTFDIPEGCDTTPEEALNAALAASLFHTYNEWKQLGLQVKRGEKAALSCMLWKHTTKPGAVVRAARKAAGKDENAEDPHFYMAKAYLFSRAQVEKPTAKPAGRTPEQIAAYNKTLADQRRAAKTAAQEPAKQPEPVPAAVADYSDFIDENGQICLPF